MLCELTLRNFRNYKEFSLKFYAPLTGIFGPNGSGKTSLLEAIFFLSRLKGFRGERFPRLLRWGSSEGEVRARTHRGELLLRWERGELKRLYQGEEQPARRWATLFPVLSFIPEDAFLFLAEPQRRRQHLNALCSYSNPAYLETLLLYEIRLRQLKALLHNPRSQEEEIRVYTALLREGGEQLSTFRERTLRALEGKLAPLIQELFKKRCELLYSPRALPPEEEILARFRKGEGDEEATLLSGPHRDDFTLTLSGKPVRLLSQGERKAVGILLILAEALLIGEEQGEPPLLLLDEWGDELDPQRGAQLLALLLSLNLPCLFTSVTPSYGETILPGLHSLSLLPLQG